MFINVGIVKIRDYARIEAIEFFWEPELALVSFISSLLELEEACFRLFIEVEGSFAFLTPLHTSDK